MSIQEKSEPRRPAPTGPALPICWPIFNDADEQQMLAEVAEWVDWTRWRFALDHCIRAPGLRGDLSLRPLLPLPTHP